MHLKICISIALLSVASAQQLPVAGMLHSTVAGTDAHVSNAVVCTLTEERPLGCHLHNVSIASLSLFYY